MILSTADMPDAGTKPPPVGQGVGPVQQGVGSVEQGVGPVEQGVGSVEQGAGQPLDEVESEEAKGSGPSSARMIWLRDSSLPPGSARDEAVQEEEGKGEEG